MKSFPFDSHVDYDEEGTPIFDRAVNSKVYRHLLRELFDTGIMYNPSTNLQVTAGEGMNVIVLPGFAMVDGVMNLEEENRTIALQAADSVYDRIDTIVLRLNNNDSVRTCDLFVVEGVPSQNPVRPDLTREGDIYEIGLADVFITKNNSVITEAKITDTRYEEERCGVINSLNRMADIIETVENHVSDTVRHITGAERAKWNSKPSLTASQTDITAGSTALETGQLYVVYE